MAERGTDIVLAIVGSVSLARNEQARQLVADAMVKHHPARVVTGGAPGVDSMAEVIARNAGIPVTVHFPGIKAWRKGEPDGFEARNILIARDCTHLVRIVASDSKTYGSGWTRDYAANLGKPTEEHVVPVT